MKNNKILPKLAVLVVAAGALTTSVPAVASIHAPSGILDSSVSHEVAPTVYTDSSKYTSSNVNMRKGIGTKHKVVKVLKKGTKVKVKKTKNGWSYVSHGGKNGWVSSKYLKAKPAKNVAYNKSNKHTANEKKMLRYLKDFGCANVKVTFAKGYFGANGQVNMGNQTMKLNSKMPTNRIKYVVAHECQHIKQARVYKSNWNALYGDLKKIHKTNSNVRSLELNADCATRALGIKEYNYTKSCSKAELNAAKRIWNGKKAR